MSNLMMFAEGVDIFTSNTGKKTTALRFSGSRTKVIIAGQQSDRSQLKPGMTCEISYPDETGGEAQVVDNRN